MTNKKKFFTLVIVILIATPLIFLGINKVAPVSWNIWGDVNSTNGIAIKGYDPVAYFRLDKAIPGNSSLTTHWKDTTWQFSAPEHQSLFEENPEKYAPQFGGYCATAISIGMTADVDPNSWHIENGELYLFFNDEAKHDYIAGINNGIIQQSEQKWQSR